MFLNFKRLYLFLGSIVFSINSFTSDRQNHSRHNNCANYRGVDLALQRFGDRTNSTLATLVVTKKDMEEFARKEDTDSFERRLDIIMMRLNELERMLDTMVSRLNRAEEESKEAVNISYFNSVTDALSKKCEELEERYAAWNRWSQQLMQENMRLRRELENFYVTLANNDERN